jgi:type II secretory pathway component PulC
VRAADAARAPDRRTLDALALADVMTSDRGTRSPRGPAQLRGIAPSGDGRSAPPTGAEAPVVVRPTSEAQARSAASVAPAAPPVAAAVVSRAELDGALADFAALAAGVRASFSTSGVAMQEVRDGTIFQRAGLRAGDVISSVDGVRLRSIDDAANLYARASTARAFTAQIVRAGKPVTLRVVIR